MTPAQRMGVKVGDVLEWQHEGEQGRGPVVYVDDEGDPIVEHEGGWRGEGGPHDAGLDPKKRYYWILPEYHITNMSRSETVAQPLFMSDDSADRKLMPVATGCMAYFADALLCVSFVSVNGANRHCNGVLGWDKAKSADEKDAEARHMLDALRGLPPDPGLERLGDLGHLASKAWRALADLQRACDAEREKFK